MTLWEEAAAEEEEEEEEEEEKYGERGTTHIQKVIWTITTLPRTVQVLPVVISTTYKKGEREMNLPRVKIGHNRIITAKYT